MEKAYDLAAMKSRPNPYVERLMGCAPARREAASADQENMVQPESTGPRSDV